MSHSQTTDAKKLGNQQPGVGICTTPWKETADALCRAERLAGWFGCKLVRRKNRSIERIAMDEQASVVVVADVNPQVYQSDSPGTPLFFHPGMAQQRLLRMKRGEPDRLLRVANVQSGDIVVDATLGVGNDALVLAAGVQEHGRVIAMENSWWLARLFAFAGQQDSPWYSTVGRWMANIEIRIGDHGALLSEMSDESADVVLFDPMFRLSHQSLSDLDRARGFADTSSLSADAWHEATRVARRCVVLKERPESGEFERFGLLADKRRAPFAYGVWSKSDHRAVGEHPRVQGRNQT